MNFKLLVYFGLALVGLAQGPKPHPLRPQQSIPLPGVEGRLGHLAFDAKGQRLFVAASQNNSVECIDLKSGKLIRSISGFKSPQGIVYIAESNRLVVSSRDDGTLKFLSGSSFETVATVNKFNNGDVIRYDPASRMVVAAYGDGALGFFDADGKQLGEVRLDGHPEGFVVERLGTRVLLNMPTTKSIGIVDRQKKSLVRTWPLNTVSSNYGMAFDEKSRRLFIACRTPARILTLDSLTAIQVDQRDTVADVSDIFYDAARKRLYLSGGEGQIDVVRQVNADTYEPLAKIPTAAGARTSLFVPELNIFLVAIPHRGSQRAEIRVYDVLN